MLNNPTLLPTSQQPLQQLANARRVLEMDSDSPFLGPHARRDIRLAKCAAWQVLAELVATLDVAADDADLELNGDELDGTTAEDDFADHACFYGPGCPIGEPGAEHDGCEQEMGE